MSISLTSTNELSQVGRPAQVESDRFDEPDLELADPLEGLMGTIVTSATFEGDSVTESAFDPVIYSLQSWSKKITVSAATKLIPSPPARVDKRNSLQASGESPALLNSSICSSRSGCFVVPSIRKVFQFYGGFAHQPRFSARYRDPKLTLKMLAQSSCVGDQGHD